MTMQISRMRHWRHGLHALLMAAFLVHVPAAPAATRPLTLGFTDPVFMDNAAAPAWLARVVESSGGIVRLDNRWADLAPTRPADEANPDDPAYRWSHLDTAVKQAAAAGLDMVIGVEHAPHWAQGADRPDDPKLDGAWKPDAQAFGQLGRALAARYDGTHPDPTVPGATLPSVRYFQAWNEPNLSIHYAPQWATSGGRLVRYSPNAYRSLLNAFYGGVKAVNPAAQVVAAGLAPFGDYITGGQRTPPAAFWRAVFCFRDTALHPAKCPNPASFDIFDHHPYSVGSPYRKALNPDDVTIPDMAKLTRPLRRAEQTNRALPHERHRVWASEVSWDSSPPDPDGVSEATRSVWIPQTFELLWREGVDTIFWYLVRDAKPIPSYAATYQSGMYLNDGTPKAGQRAFRFPVSRRMHKGYATIWARLPRAGTLLIERRSGSRWLTIASSKGQGGDVLDRRLKVRSGANLRVQLSGAS